LTHPGRIRSMDRYPDFTPSRPEERTYVGAPWRFAKRGYGKGRSLAKPLLLMRRSREKN
jgi:hypothetical protein